MSSRKNPRRADSHHWTPTRQPESLGTNGLVVDLINSVVVTVGGVYELTGSPLVSAIAGGLAVTIVGLVIGFRR